jgi:hypothetical protein
LDIFNERVYWVDVYTKTIASVDYNGNDWRTILYSDTLIHSPFSLVIFEEKLYWTDLYQGDVFVMNKFNGTKVRKVKLFFFYPVIYLIDLLCSQTQEFLPMLQRERERMMILLSYGRYRHKDSFLAAKMEVSYGA